VLNDVALGKWKRDEDLLYTLAGRLGRLAKRVTATEEEKVKVASGGSTVHDLAKRLVDALSPDVQIEAAKEVTGQEYLDPDDKAVKAAAKRLVVEAVAAYDNPDLRDALVQAQQRDEQTIDEVSQDTLLTSAWDVQAKERARQLVTSFRQFMEQHRDEITALQVFYSRPRHAPLRYEDIKELAEAIAAPPLGLSTNKLWQAYETLDPARVHESKKNTRRLLTDLVSLVRYTLEYDKNDTVVLEPYEETVRRRFAAWLEEQERTRGKPFTREQKQWLELMRDTVASSLTIEQDDFEDMPFIQRGGLGKAYQLFGAELPEIIQQLNERLAA
jgi:type I restriction enzyme R subunit